MQGDNLTLDEFIIENQKHYNSTSSGEFSRLLGSIKLAAKVVNYKVNKAGLVDILGDAGVYFNPEDCESIVFAIEKIIDNNSLRKFISKRAKKLSDIYSWKCCSDQTWAFIVETYRGLSHD